MATVITGANRGIGLGLLEYGARAGDRIWGTTRGDAPQVDGAEWITADVAKPETLAALPAALDGAPLDLLICNAGIAPDKGQTLDAGYAAAMWAETFAVNVTGVFLTVQAVLPNLRAARGKIAIISSQMASDTLAPGGRYIYRASKAAALNLGRNLAKDLAEDGIPVGIYHPGWVRSEMGGRSADLSIEEAAAGLMARFAILSPATTGCFETWDGRTHPF